MKFFPLAHQEMISYDGHTHMAIITADDLTTAATNTAQKIKLATLPAGSYVKRVTLKLVKAFRNSADNAFNTTAVTVGDNSAANTFITSKELNANAGGLITTPSLQNTAVGPYSAADELDITFNAMVAKALLSVNEGEVHVLAEIYDPSKLSAIKRQSPITTK